MREGQLHKSGFEHGGRSRWLRSSFAWRLVDVLWLLALMTYVLAGMPLTPFHGDEATLVYMSHDYAYQFIDRDLSRIYYSPQPSSPQEQELRLLNGTINKYAIGLAWHLAGFQVADLNEQWDWGADWHYNQQYGHAPSAGLLAAARWPSAMFTALSVALIFSIGLICGGRPAAYCASLLLALHPAILLNGRRAMMEGSLLFFSLLTVRLGVWFIREQSWRSALLLGAAGGLLLASKHTGLFTLAGVFAGCAALPVVRRQWGGARAQLLRYYNAVLLAGLAVVLIFLLLNPAWWGAGPLEVGRYVLDLRAQVLQTQLDAFGGYEGFADKLGGFWRQVFVMRPQYYEASNWAGFIGDQIMTYEASPWAGLVLGETGALLIGVLTLIGAGSLWADRARDPGQRGVILLWVLATWAGVLLLTPLEWQRYYLPALPAALLLAGIGVGHVGRVVWSRAQERKSFNPRVF